MNSFNKMKFYTLILLLTCLLAYSLTHCLDAASWPMFRAVPDRTGVLTEQAEPALSPLWNLTYGDESVSAFRISGEIVSSPVVYKGIVYFGGRDNTVWALDAATGSQIWQYSTDDWIDATPCVSDDRVYVPCRDKYVYAFDRLTGAVKWRTYTGTMDGSSPVLYNSRLYFLSGNPSKVLYEIDALSGDILHQYELSQFGFSSPAVKNNLLFFGTNNGHFNCFDLNTGKIKWSVPTKGGIYYSSLAAATTAVYAVSGEDERRLFCLDPANDGNPIWQSERFSESAILSAVSSVSLGEDKVFVACSSGPALKLMAFPRDGVSPVAPLWSVNIGVPHATRIISSPAVVNGTVYVGSGDGKLYAVRAEDGWFFNDDTDLFQQAPVGYYLSYADSISSGIVSSPAVSDGKVFAATYDGQLWAFKAAKIASISSPDNGARIVNSAGIEGNVVNADLIDYTLEYGQGTAPSQWIEISTGTEDVPGGTLGTWNVQALSDGAYSLRLTVNDGQANLAVNRVIVDNPAQIPSGLKAEDTPFDGGGSLTLTWNRSVDDGAGDNDVTIYKIYKSANEGGYAYLASVSAGTTSYIDSACPAQTTYYYVITAVDASSESSYSGPAWAYSIVDGTEINPATGGTVALSYNGTVTEVVVEPNTFSETVWIGIRVPAAPPETGKPANSKDTGVVREFGVTPANAVFSKMVVLKIPYSAAEAAGMSKENLRIYWWDEAKTQWRIVNTSDPDTENGRVWAAVPHFSLYRVMEYTPGIEELLSEDKVYTYPNPAKGDKLYFKYYLGSKADVTIDVYNVAGELVAHLEKTSCPAGIVSEIEWSIGSIASGVYVYRIEADAAGVKKAIKKKLAVIH